MATLPLILQSIQVRWTSHAGPIWGSEDKIINDMLLQTLKQAHSCWPACKDLHQHYADSGCHLEDQPGVMNDERERESLNCIGSVT